MNETNRLMQEKLKNRDSSLDLIRIVAFLSVLSVHSFLKGGFYSVPVEGALMYWMTVLRTFFMDCVPLFLLLTGYLMRKKELSFRFYAGIEKTALVYLLASLCCLYVMETPEPLTFKEGLLDILKFKAAPYAWYIEMYFGLFLLIPFLNILYRGLETKSKKLWLILTFLLLTALPGVVNAKYKILPTFFTKLYPVTYYFIGAYLSEYPVKIKRRWLLLLLLAHLPLSGWLNFHLSYGKSFVWGSWCDWGSVVNVITATLVFLLILGIPTLKWPLWVKAPIKWLSSLTLAGYLVSSIYDTRLYPLLKKQIPVIPERFPYYPLMVVNVVYRSLLLALGITVVVSLWIYFRKWLFRRISLLRKSNEK